MSFFQTVKAGRMMLVVYEDDILIIGDYKEGIQRLKSFLLPQFQLKDLRQLRWFLRIEVARSQLCISLSQRNCVLDLLSVK